MSLKVFDFDFGRVRNLAGNGHRVEARQYAIEAARNFWVDFEVRSADASIDSNAQRAAVDVVPLSPGAEFRNAAKQVARLVVLQARAAHEGRDDRA